MALKSREICTCDRAHCRKGWHHYKFSKMYTNSNISLVFSFLISSIYECLYCLYQLYSDSHRNLVKDISNLLRNRLATTYICIHQSIYVYIFISLSVCVCV